MKKNLLIGSITNYLWEDVAPFFKSFERAGFENCDCVMFVANMSDKTIEKIKSCGVIVQKIPEKFQGQCIIDYRWELYIDFLRDKREDYAMIFTADVRDTIFQADVFKFYRGNKKFLGLALEDGILSEPCNKSWLIRRYGEETYESIKNKRIICTGTVWGTFEEFFNFAEAMTENLKSNKYNYFNVSDQATGNWLIYHENLFADIIITSENKNGQVMTIGISARENIKLDSNDNILNGRGEIAAVAHQYDRHRDIFIKVINKFCPEYKIYYDAVIFNSPGFIWRVVRYFYRIRKIGLFKALYITIRKRLPGGEKFS